MLDWLKPILSESYTDDIEKKISAEIGKSFVAKADFNKTKDDLKAEKAKSSDYEKQIKELNDKSEGAADLQAKIDELQKQIKDREDADTKAAADKAIADRFTAAAAENKFLNEYTQKGVMDEFKAALEDKANKGKSDIDIFGAIVKDREGIFANPNQITGTPGSGNVDPDKMNDDKIRAVMGLPTEK